MLKIRRAHTCTIYSFQYSLLPTVVDTSRPSSSFIPSSLPSYHPTAHPSTPPTVSTSPTVAHSSHPSKSSAPITPTASPTESVAPTYEYIRPGRVDLRYVTWERLTDEQRSVASDDLKYNQQTWNELGTNQLEDLRWSYLNASQRSSASLLGYDEPSWNCFQNHFESFSWLQLEEMELDVYFAKLGWDIASWNAAYGDPPVSRLGDWDSLTGEQQPAANQLLLKKHS